MGGQGVKFISLTTKQDIEKIFMRFQARAEEKMEEILRRAGEYFITEARNLKTYENRTGNLRSSIGYVVLNNSRVVIQSDFEPVKVMARAAFTDPTGKRQPEIKQSVGSYGAQTGRDFINDIAKDFPTGIVLIGVAGMEYARFVEAVHSLDVITGPAIKTQEFIRRTMMSLKAKM